MTLREPELDRLRGINERIDLDEVAAVYLPLSRLLNLYVSATQDLHKVSATFLGAMAPKVPYVIGVAGSVAVGKSTFARILQALLAQWPDHPKVDLITTDGFLHPNRVLEERGIMDRKSFPESYDTRELLRVLREVKSGQATVEAPVYSHVVYDIVDDEVTRHPVDSKRCGLSDDGERLSTTEAGLLGGAAAHLARPQVAEVLAVPSLRSSALLLHRFRWLLDILDDGRTRRRGYVSWKGKQILVFGDEPLGGRTHDLELQELELAGEVFCTDLQCFDHGIPVGDFLVRLGELGCMLSEEVIALLNRSPKCSHLVAETLVFI